MHEFVMTVFDTLSQLGYLGIALGLMIEIIPSEIVLSYGGFLIDRGEITFLGALLAGVIGGTIAQLFLYWMGSYGGRPFLERFGKFILIQPKHLDAAERWFERYGAGVVFSARFVPVVRHAISIPAGIAKMPASKFILLTVGAMIPWTVLFLLLGMQLGNHWDAIQTYAKPFVLPIMIIAVGAIVIYFILKKRKA
jgi:membrane protein DedA with SNARE-associated domain